MAAMQKRITCYNRRVEYGVGRDMNITVDIGQILMGIAQLVTVGLLVRNMKAGRRRDKAIEEIHLATNSMKDALVSATAMASDLAGEKRGREDEVARQAAASEAKRET